MLTEEDLNDLAEGIRCMKGFTFVDDPGWTVARAEALLGEVREHRRRHDSGAAFAEAEEARAAFADTLQGPKLGGASCS